MPKPFRFLLQFFFPARCLFCRKHLPYDAKVPFCESCRLYLASLSPRELPIPAGSCLYLLDYAAGSQDPDAAPRTMYRIRDGEEPTALPVPAGKSVRSFMPCGDSLYYTVQASQSLYDETEAVEVWRCAPDFSDAEYL